MIEANDEFGVTSELRPLALNENEAANEITRLVHRPPSGIHPMRHLSLASWLFQDFNSFLRTYETWRGESGLAPYSDMVVAGPTAPDLMHRTLLEKVRDEA